MLCGAFLFGEPGHPALGGRPRLVHLAGDSDRAPGAWRREAGRPAELDTRG